MPSNTLADGDNLNAGVVVAETDAALAVFTTAVEAGDAFYRGCCRVP